MDRTSLDYSHFEKLPLRRPVDRLEYISELCRGRSVLDIGCLDETALIKRDTLHWLHSRICSVATEVVGVDNSTSIPAEGIVTARNGVIFHGDASSLDHLVLPEFDPEVIVAGEFIEHIADPSNFLASIRRRFPGRTVILSTPNGCSFSNFVMGIFRREVQHPDHLHNYTFKTLHTMCARAGFRNWTIVPYRFFATELILRSRGVMRLSASATEWLFRGAERMFPALGFGYIVVAEV